jgi:hypothetical protein
MTNPGFELVYLPYISLRGVEKLQFGRVTLWNFDARPATSAPRAQTAARNHSTWGSSASQARLASGRHQ